MINAPIRILIVAGLCVLALLGLVIRESMARAAGTEILMAMEAVDPRALLSGHYVVIGLQERLESNQSCPPSLTQITGPWLALTPNGAHHSVAGAAESREAALAMGPLAVRGDAFCREPTTSTPEQAAPDLPGALNAGLGIERFHINQTEALRIEALLRAQTTQQASRVFAILSIGQDGRARLKGLEVDGERLELTWL